MSRDEKTYGQIRQKYDEWVEMEVRRPARDHLRRVDAPNPVPRDNTDMTRLVFAGIGFGIGAILLILAIVAFATASSWSDYGRDGAVVGYTLVGIFLIIAGGGGIIATWNHNFRVLVRPPRHPH